MENRYTVINFTQKRGGQGNKLSETEAILCSEKGHNCLMFNMYVSEEIKKRGLNFALLQRDNINGGYVIFLNKTKGLNITYNSTYKGKANARVTCKELVDFLKNCFGIPASEKRVNITLSHNLSKNENALAYMLSRT